MCVRAHPCYSERAPPSTTQPVLVGYACGMLGCRVQLYHMGLVCKYVTLSIDKVNIIQ